MREITRSPREPQAGQEGAVLRDRYVCDVSTVAVMIVETDSSCCSEWESTQSKGLCLQSIAFPQFLSEG